jgi:hypothetical protein
MRHAHEEGVKVDEKAIRVRHASITMQCLCDRRRHREREERREDMVPGKDDPATGLVSLRCG